MTIIISSLKLSLLISEVMNTRIFSNRREEVVFGPCGSALKCFLHDVVKSCVFFVALLCEGLCVSGAL